MNAKCSKNFMLKDSDFCVWVEFVASISSYLWKSSKENRFVQWTPFMNMDDSRPLNTKYKLSEASNLPNRVAYTWIQAENANT